MGDIFVASSINSKIFFEENPKIFDEMTTKKLLNIRAAIRNKYETIIVGGNTIKKDNPTLLNMNMSNIRIVIDKYADLDFKSNIFQKMPEKTYLILLKTNEEYEKKLLIKGVNVIKLEKASDYEIIKKVEEIALGKVLIEGGAKTIGMFLQNKFIENIIIVQFPIFLPNNCLGIDYNLSKMIRCSLKTVKIIDETFIFQCYRVM